MLRIALELRALLHTPKRESLQTKQIIEGIGAEEKNKIPMYEDAVVFEGSC